MTKSRKDNKSDQLAIDAAAARAAGLSYSKWRAMQPQTPREQKTPKDFYIRRLCLECGAEFIVNSSRTKKYCSEECKRRAYKRKNREGEKAAK